MDKNQPIDSEKSSTSSPSPKSTTVTQEGSQEKPSLKEICSYSEEVVEVVSKISEETIVTEVKACLEECIIKSISEEESASLIESQLKPSEKSHEHEKKVSVDDEDSSSKSDDSKEDSKDMLLEPDDNGQKNLEELSTKADDQSSDESSAKDDDDRNSNVSSTMEDDRNSNKANLKATNSEDDNDSIEERTLIEDNEKCSKDTIVDEECNSNELSLMKDDQSSNEPITVEDQNSNGPSLSEDSNEPVTMDEDQNSNEPVAMKEDQNSNEPSETEDKPNNKRLATKDDQRSIEKQTAKQLKEFESESTASKEDTVERYKLPPVELSQNAEDSRGSDQSKPESKNGGEKPKRSSCRTSLRKEMSQIGHVARQIGAQEVIEYQWPPNSEHHYFLQEQISDYLEVVSFRRRYPELTRRNIEPNERNYLLDRGLVNETQSDLGLVPLRSEEVMELIEKDYPEKCKEIAKVLRERERKKMIETVKTTYSSQKTIDKHKLEHLRKKAIKGASEFNSSLRRERKDERRVYFDLQTMQVHFPQRKLKLKDPSYRLAYPAALIPGQYTDYTKKYNHTQMKCLPMNCALRLPPTPPPELETHFSDDSESSKSDEESQSSDASSEDESNNEIVPEEVEKEPIQTTPVNRSPRTPVGGRARRKRRGAFLFSMPRKLPPKPVGRPPGPGRGRGRGRGRRGRPPLRNVAREIPPLKLNLSALPKVSPDSPAPKDSSEEVCGICRGDDQKNKEGSPEGLVKCGDCGRAGHPTCYEISHMLTQIRKYSWQCMECKACAFCESTRDEDKMIFCDQCDRGYHTFCLGIPNIPSGSWQCPKCSPKRRTSDDSLDSDVEILPTKRRKTLPRNSNGYKKEASSEGASN